MQRPITQRSDSPSPFPTSSTSQAMPSPERWSSSPAQIRVSVSVSLPLSSSPSKVRLPLHLCRSSQLISLSPSTPRANIPRPLRHLDFHTHPPFLSRPSSSPLERRDCPPNRRRAAPACSLPPGPARPHHIPLPHPSSALLAPVNRLRQRARTNTIRGQRLRWRCMEEPEQASDEPVSRRRIAAIPWRRQH